MPVEFNSDAENLAAKHGFEVRASASFGPKADHLCGKGGLAVAASAGCAAGQPEIEMYPYSPFGRPAARIVAHLEIFDKMERMKWSDEWTS